MKKCIFFDRDGIVNISPGPGYVESWADFHLQDGFVRALQKASEKGYCAVIITNQRGVARGITPESTIIDIHSRLRDLLKNKHGLDLQDIFYCPHEKDSCDCRKPLPGMILRAAEKHGIDLESSWMVGDQEKDIQAGRAAGCRTILVSDTVTGTGADCQVDHIDKLPDLLESVLSD